MAVSRRGRTPTTSRRRAAASTTPRTTLRNGARAARATPTRPRGTTSTPSSPSRTSRTRRRHGDDAEQLPRQSALPRLPLSGAAGPRAQRDDDPRLHHRGQRRERHKMKKRGECPCSRQVIYTHAHAAWVCVVRADGQTGSNSPPTDLFINDSFFPLCNLGKDASGIPAAAASRRAAAFFHQQWDNMRARGCFS